MAPCPPLHALMCSIIKKKNEQNDKCLAFLIQFLFFAFCEKQLHFLSSSSFSSTRKTISKTTQYKNFNKCQYNAIMAQFLCSWKIFAQTFSHYYLHPNQKNCMAITGIYTG